MISGVGSVAVLVNDPNKSAEWYRDKLGFEIVENKGHTVFVRAKGAEVLLHLCGHCGDWESDKPGGRTGIWLHCGNVKLQRRGKSGTLMPASDPAEVERTYVDLKECEVEFSQELTTTDWGKYAVLRDPDGNEFELS